MMNLLESVTTPPAAALWLATPSAGLAVAPGRSHHPEGEINLSRLYSDEKIDSRHFIGMNLL